MTSAQAEIIWNTGDLPVSARFDDPYFSMTDGLAETRHVFLDGNDLPTRLSDGFHIAELGFGTGLNFLATLHLWRSLNRAGTLQFTSFEAYPMSRPDMARALEAFPQLSDISREFLSVWTGPDRETAMNGARLTVISGDARLTLPDWPGRADAWFLDGFSPAKNPELWGAELMTEVARHTAACGTAATYSAAGHIRQKLADAGFTVNRTPGFGRKRHMTRARLDATA